MQRKDVALQHKWNIEDLYPTDEAWEIDYEKLSKELNFSSYSGKISDRGELLKFYKATDAFCIKLERLYAYAGLKHDEDATVGKYLGYRGKAEMLFSSYSEQIAFFDSEMAAQSDEYLNSLLSDKDFAPYDYQISLIIKGKKHIVSAEEEKVVALAGQTISSFYDIFGMIDNADLNLPDIEFNGKKQKLTHGLYGLILHSQDRAAREDCYNKYYGAYNKLINTITANYYGNVKKDVFLSRVYKFDSCLERALFNEDVDRKVYDNLLESVSENCSVMHRYISDRKKILGYDKLYFYDIYAPLVGDCDIKLSYEDAFEYVVEGLSVLGKDYQNLLRKAYKERWVDVDENEGKRSGAYSLGVYGVHPYVLLNYQPTTSDIFTIAHELGHSLHTYFSQKNQPYAKSEYKIFVAEVASTVNETLLLKHMLKNAEDINLKKYLLNYYLDSTRATLHRQTMFAEFEYKAHSLVENGEPLTRENLNELYADLGKKYYGNDIEHDYNISIEWCRIPHFYSSFYVYKYSTGIITAMNIVHRLLTEGESAREDYFKFLSGGASTDPVSLLKLAGVDLTTKQPYEFAMKEFEEALNEFEKLMNI